jgi:hypothetical protein
MELENRFSLSAKGAAGVHSLCGFAFALARIHILA